MWALSIFVAVIVLVILSLSGSRYLKRISRSIVSGILLSILLTLIDPTLPYVYGIAYLICLIIIWTPVRFWKRLLIAFPLVVALVLRISGSLCGSINEGNLWKLSDHKDNKSIYQTIIDNPEVNRIKESAAMDFQPYIPRLNSEKTLYPLYCALKYVIDPNERYDPVKRKNPDHSYDSSELSELSNNPIQNLAEDSADIILSTGITNEQRNLLKESGYTLNITEINREAIVFFVNIQNPVNALSVADIKRIYKGKVANWLLLGGNLTPIRAYQYFYHSPEQAWLLGFMEGSPLIPAISERIVPSMSYYRQTCLYKNDKGGLGFGYRNNLIDGINANEIKLLSIGTEEPSRENIVNGAYPLVQAIYAVTVSRKPVTEESRLRQENTEYLIEWLLSDQGQSLVEAAVYARMK